MTPLPRHGLYAITAAGTAGAQADPARLAALVGAAIDGGAVMIQHRAKGRTRRERRTAAARLLECCRSRRVPLIVNDDPVLAAEIGADGVHVGRDDGGVRAARRIVGDQCIVGASCYDCLDRAVAAVGDGASYVAFGSFFASATKPRAVPAPIALLPAARARLDVPIAAIGGITAANGGALVEAGASFLAAIGGVFGGGGEGGEDGAAVERMARGYAALFSQPPSGGGHRSASVAD